MTTCNPPEAEIVARSFAENEGVVTRSSTTPPTRN